MAEAAATNVVEFPTPAANVPVAGSKFTPTEIVEKLLKMRAKIKEIKDRQKEEMAPYSEAEAYLETRLMGVLNETGASSMRTSAGTFYTAKRVSASVQEWSKTLAYIQAHELWELLEARVSKTAVLAIIEERKEPIPGVSVSTDLTLHVRSV